MDPKAADLLREIDALEVGNGMTPGEREAVADRVDRLAARAPALLAGAAPDDAAQVWRRLAMAESWLERRPSPGVDWLRTAAALATSPELRAAIEGERARLEDLALLVDVLPLIKAGRAARAKALLRRRRELAGSADERARVDALLADPRTFAVPVNVAPPMWTVNGLGTALYGNRSPRSDGTYVATLYFVLLFFPILPLGAYVVRKIHPGWQFFAKVPLTPFQVWWRRLAFLAPALLIGAVVAANAWENSPWRKETAAISAAEASLKRDDPAGALAALAPVRGSQDPARAARLAELGATGTDALLDTLREPGDLSLFLTRDARLIRPAWTSEATADRVERVAVAVARQEHGGPPAADFLRWAQKGVPAFAPRGRAAAMKASDVANDPGLDALALHAPALDRMERRLRAGRFDGWDHHALAFIAAAPAERAREILFLRAERAWKGLEHPGRLLELKGLPTPLDALFPLDAEKDLAKKARALEALADIAGLPDPLGTWHRLGVARRLSETYGLLSEKDPAAWPIAKANPWTLRAHELAPDDPDLRLRALRILVDEGDYPRAVALGEAATSDARALVWLGVAYARSDRPADAARVLRPYVAANLETFLGSYEDWIALEKSLSERLWASLSNGTGDRSVIERLNRLPQDRADAEADRWIREKIKANPAMKKLHAVWFPVEAVYPAALELAMAELALATGDARPARLREAERLFLQLRRVSSDPHQELQLGQVYFWLGKAAEGQAIFEAIEKKGDGELLLKMGGLFRELGRDADARRVLEAAYAKLTGDRRYAAALRRAYAWKSLEDRRDWLRKCDTTSPGLKAELSGVDGEIFLRDGRYKEAARELKAALAYQAKLEESDKSFNNLALLELDIARAAGEVDRLAVARTLLRKAVDKDPQDGIVLNNYVDSLTYLAFFALSGEALQVKTVHDLPSLQWINWRSPPLSAEAWAAAARAQPEFRQAAELGPRAAILSPDNTTGVWAQLNYAWLTRDAAAVRALRASVEALAKERPPQVDAPDDPKASKEPPAPKESLWIARVEEARKAGHPATLAYHLVRLAADTFRTDHEGSLKAALEARALHDCVATRRYLMNFRTGRAAEALSGHDPDYEAWEEAEELPDELGMAVFLHLHPEKLEEFRAMPEVKLMAAAAEEAAALPSPTANFRTWRVLRMAGSPKEAEVKAALIRDTMQLDSLLIDLAIDGGVTDVVDAWQAARLYGDADLAEKIAADARRRELLPALFGN